jgi:hypothetical protein
MRHLWSFLGGIVAAPVTWLLIAFGQGQSTQTVERWLDRGTFDSVDLIQPAAYLAAAGVVLGLVATLRTSPLGPLVAGLLLAGVYAGMFADPFAVRDRVPDDWTLFGDHIPLRTPLTNGTLLLVGALLIMSVFSAQRWRTWPAAEPTAVAEPTVVEPETDAEPATDAGGFVGAEPADAPGEAVVPGQPDVAGHADAPGQPEVPGQPDVPETPAAVASGADGSAQAPATGASSPWSAPPRSSGTT